MHAPTRLRTTPGLRGAGETIKTQPTVRLAHARTDRHTQARHSEDDLQNCRPRCPSTSYCVHPSAHFYSAAATETSRGPSPRPPPQRPPACLPRSLLHPSPASTTPSLPQRCLTMSAKAASSERYQLQPREEKAGRQAYSMRVARRALLSYSRTTVRGQPNQRRLGERASKPRVHAKFA